MTPGEIVRANLTHSEPDRPGMNFSGGRMDDFLGANLDPSRAWTPRRWTEGGIEYYDDEWGSIWRRMVDGSLVGEIFRPAIEDWSALDDLTLPDLDDPSRYKTARRVFSQPTDKFRLAGMPGWVFATGRYLRKMEVYLVDLVGYRAEVDRLNEIITDLLVRVIHLYGEAGADGIAFCEDLGVQDRLLMSPSMWRDVFKRHYERLTAAAHEHGMSVLMHSCGYNWDLIDDLADAGIDCFQFDQPALYDLPALAEKLRSRRKALWSPVDIQKVLPTGNRELIEAEAEKMVCLFRGGLIMKSYPDPHGIGVEDEWDEWAYQAVLRAAGIAPPQASRGQRDGE